MIAYWTDNYINLKLVNKLQQIIIITNRYNLKKPLRIYIVVYSKIKEKLKTTENTFSFIYK